MNFAQLLAFLPERWRPLAASLLTLALATVTLCSIASGLMPSRWLLAPGALGVFARVVHRLGALRTSLESGTLKLPGAGPAAAGDERAALLARLSELDAQRVTTAPPAPRGSPGIAQASTLLTILVTAVLTLAFATVLGALTQGCGPGRELVMRVTPGVPSPSDCTAGASRCEGAVPVVCSASGRWWPATPASAPCAHGCAMDDAGAYCAADGGAL